jgi:hypothetical protein
MKSRNIPPWEVLDRIVFPIVFGIFLLLAGLCSAACGTISQQKAIECAVKCGCECVECAVGCLVDENLEQCPVEGVE